MVSFSCRISPLTSTVILRRKIAVGDRGGDLGDVTHLSRQIVRHEVDGVREVLPGAGDAAHVRLTAEPPLGADLASDARDLAGEGVQLIDHRVDGLLQLEDLAAHVHGDLPRQVAVGDRRGDLGDVAYLRRQVARHEVDVVRQILPGAGDTRNLRLPAELALGADLARDARDFGGEGVELIDHGVDGVFELEDLPLHVYRDLSRQVATRDGGRYVGDVADLRRQVVGHRVDGVGKVLPGAGDAGDDGLPAEAPVGADLARHTGHLRGEGA